VSRPQGGCSRSRSMVSPVDRFGGGFPASSRDWTRSGVSHRDNRPRCAVFTAGDRDGWPHAGDERFPAAPSRRIGTTRPDWSPGGATPRFGRRNRSLPKLIDNESGVSRAAGMAGSSTTAATDLRFFRLRGCEAAGILLPLLFLHPDRRHVEWQPEHIIDSGRRTRPHL